MGIVLRLKWMHIEEAAGFVTFYPDDNQLKVVLLDHGSHISHPKGHMKGKETKLDTAIRELEEETSLNVEIHSKSPVHRKKYTIKKRKKKLLKKVFLFAAVALPGEIIISKEHRRYLLLVPKQAMDTLTYAEDKEALEFALKWVSETKYKEMLTVS